MQTHNSDVDLFGYEIQFSQPSSPSSMGKQSAVSGISSGKSARCASCRIQKTDPKAESQSKEVLLPSS